MAKASTVAYAKKVLTPLQFKAWKAMSPKLSKSELAAGKKPSGRKAAPKKHPRGSKAKSSAQHKQLMSALSYPPRGAYDEADVKWIMDSSGMPRAQAVSIAKDAKQMVDGMEREHEGISRPTVSNPAKKSRKGKRSLPANRRKMRAGMTVQWVDRNGRKQIGVVHTARAKSSTVIGRASMRFEEHLNKSLYPLKENCGYRKNPSKSFSVGMLNAEQKKKYNALDARQKGVFKGEYNSYLASGIHKQASMFKGSWHEALKPANARGYGMTGYR